jgi:microcystin-dependent protein
MAHSQEFHMLAFIKRRPMVALSTLALSTLCGGQAHAQAEPFLGQISCFAFDFAPKGWLPADGRLLSISQNSALFALLGTYYGGNGSTNFALPDLRGRAVISVGQGPGLALRSQGEMGGAESVTLSVNNLPPHAHTVAPLGSSSDASDISPAGKAPASKARTALYALPTPGVSLAASTSSSVGSGTPVSTMPPYLTLNCAIAVTGVFPSRP